MTTRERHLAVIVVAILGVGAVGLLAYTLVLSPLIDKDKQVKLKENEVATLELDISTIQFEQKKFEAFRQQSLPADVGVSREKYFNLLEGLVRRAEFPAGANTKITQSEPDAKSAPTIAPKKNAYTKLTYDLTFKAQLYHVIDFMQLFYRQPLLHSIKSINIQRPSDQRAQGLRQLDVTMKIEAIVLDNAPQRPTLLPIVRELALLSGAAAQTGFSLFAVSGRGSPIPPAGILADEPREYLAIAGKDMFFGPPPPSPKWPEPKDKEDDHSRFITLVSVVGEDDGTIKAAFRDKLDNHNYTITQSPKGAIAVRGEWELNGKTRLVPGYDEKRPGCVMLYPSGEAENRCDWRVRRVLLDSVILEKLDAEDPDSDTRPKLHALAGIGGGPGAFVALPEAGKLFRVYVGQDLDTDPKDPMSEKRTAPPPSRFLLTREAWKEIYAPLFVPTSSGDEDKRGR